MEPGLEQLQWSRRKVALLEQADARQAAYTQPNYQSNFRIAVSCPPSTVIHMRGGQVWVDPDITGQQWYVEPASYDLADPNDTGHNYTFTNPHYYRGYAVLLYWYANPGAVITYPIRLFSTGEYATAAEAENAVYPVWPDGRFRHDAYYGQPLGVVIIRNNGNTSSSNQFMPIDKVNRGRSYLWRDIKVRFQW